MVRSAIVIVATLVLLLGIAPISQPQAQNDGAQHAVPFESGVH